MLRVAARRGPDGQRLWTGDGAAFGHALLATTPEARVDAQPVHAAGRFTLVADARVDNRAELLRALHRSPSLAGRPSSAISDADLILAGFVRWGDRVLDRLVGDYAFAVWDARSRRLFCARDPIGVRPLFYSTGPRDLALASSVPALLAYDRISRRPDAQHVRTFVEDAAASRLGTADSTTFFADVRRLPPAHALTADAEGRVRTWRYWWPEETLPILRLNSDADYEEGFRDVFDAAVDSCLRTNGPAGVALSGGIDSSAVAAVARERCRTTGPSDRARPNVSCDLHAFTGVFRPVNVPFATGSGAYTESGNRPGTVTPDLDEWAYARSILDGGGFTSHVVRADRLDPLYGMQTLVDVYGQPYAPRSHYLVTRIAETARDAGVRVMLDGSEGDLVVGYGYDYFQLLAAGGAWDAFADLAATYSDHCAGGGRRYAPDRAFWDHGADALLDHVAAGHWRRFAREAAVVRKRLGISSRRFLRRALQRVRHGRPDDAAARLRAGGERAAVIERVRALVENPMLADTLDVADALSAAYGLEARHPFFDRRVVEYCLALPAEQRLKDGWTRSILRRALRDVLPDAIRTRVGKSNLGLGVATTLENQPASRLAESIRPHDLAPFVDAATVVQSIHQFTESPTPAHAKPLLTFSALSVWKRRLEAGKEAESDAPCARTCSAVKPKATIRNPEVDSTDSQTAVY